MLAEASAEADGPVPGYLSAPQSGMDTCLYIFTSGTTGEHRLPSQTAGRGRQETGTHKYGLSFQAALRTLPATPAGPDCPACLPLSFCLASTSFCEKPSRGGGRQGLRLRPFPVSAHCPQASLRLRRSVT